MKTWIILSIVIGLILFIGTVLIMNSAPVKAEENPTTITSAPACSYANPSCSGSGKCTAGNNCGNPSCGAEKTGTCGCRG